MMKTLRDVVAQTWCRVVHGHVMQKIGDVGNSKTLWTCARCLKMRRIAHDYLTGEGRNAANSTLFYLFLLRFRARRCNGDRLCSRSVLLDLLSSARRAAPRKAHSAPRNNVADTKGSPSWQI